jgi:hypothetical protein
VAVGHVRARLGGGGGGERKPWGSVGGEGGGNFGSLTASPRRKTHPDLDNFGSPTRPQNIYQEAFVMVGRDGAAPTVALVGAAPD